MPIPTRSEFLDALAAAYRDGGFRCQITGVKLLIGKEHRTSPRYLTLDHYTPSASSGGWKVVAALVNDMKSDLDGDEFERLLPLAAAAVAAPSAHASQLLEAAMDGLKHFGRISRPEPLAPSATPDRTSRTG